MAHMNVMPVRIQRNNGNCRLMANLIQYPGRGGGRRGAAALILNALACAVKCPASCLHYFSPEIPAYSIAPRQNHPAVMLRGRARVLPILYLAPLIVAWQGF